MTRLSVKASKAVKQHDSPRRGLGGENPVSQKIKPEWILSDEWAVARDPYNWILMRKTGKCWRKTYYASPEQMLKALYRKLTRTEPSQPDLLLHLKRCLEIAQVFSRRFYEQDGTRVAVGENTASNVAKSIVRA